MKPLLAEHQEAMPIDYKESMPIDSQIVANEKVEAVSSATSTRTIFNHIDDQAVFVFGIVLGIVALSYFILMVYQGYQRYVLRSGSGRQ